MWLPIPDPVVCIVSRCPEKGRQPGPPLSRLQDFCPHKADQEMEDFDPSGNNLQPDATWLVDLFLPMIARENVVILLDPGNMVIHQNND